MKKLLLAALMMGTFNCVFAQTETAFYYYEGKEVHLPVTYQKMVIGLKNQTSFAAARNNLAASLGVAADSVKPTSTANQYVVAFSGAQQTSGKQLAATLLKRVDIAYVHPCLVGQAGKLVSYGELFVVKLKLGTTASQFSSVISKFHVTIARRSLGNKTIYQLAAGAQNNYDGLLLANTLFKTGLFEFSEPDFTTYGGLADAAKKALADAPNDPLYNLQWAHHNTGSPEQYGGIPGADMQVDSAWLITKGDTTIKVAVIDTGVDTANADLKKNLLQGFDCTTLTANPGDGYPRDSTNAHGTACAGIVGAVVNNNRGVAGIAPRCKIIPISLTNEYSQFASDFGIAEGIRYAWQNGADVITNSWTMGSPSGTITSAIHEAVTMGRGGKGCVVFFASGNDNSAINYPSSLSEVISVGGSTMFNQHKTTINIFDWGANYGGGLDVVAPCIYIATTDISGSGGYNTTAGTDGDYYLLFNGTSAAAPHAAAVAALVLSVNKTLTGTDVRTIIENNCTKAGDYVYSTTTGNFNGTWNQEMGYGVVNAYKSVLAAKSGLFCGVGIVPPIRSFLCKNASVKLSVADSISTATYTWRLNGVNIKTGASITLNTPGIYDVVAVFANTCIATAPAVTITAADTAALVADAGKTITLCPGNNGVIIGGEPSAKGGAPFIAQQRAYGYDLLYSTFTRFNTNNPRDYKFISPGIKDGNTATQFVAGDFTPMGYYAVNRLNELVRIDTATGYMRLIGKLAPQSGQYISSKFTGLAWNPVLKKLYGITSGNTVKGMYEINPVSGRAVPLAVNPFSGGSDVSWGTFSGTGGLYIFNASYGNVTRLPFYGNSGNFTSEKIIEKTMLAQLDGSFDPLNGKLYLTTYAPGQILVGDLREIDSTGGKPNIKGSIGGISEVGALAISGGTYKYSWAPSTGLSNAKDANPVARPTQTTTYTLTVTDACGASSTSSVVVTISATKPPVAITASIDSICVGDSSRLVATKNPNYTYQWMYNGAVVNNNTDTVLMAGRGGNIQVTVTNGRGGCANTSKTFKLKDCSIWLNNNNPDTACFRYFYPPHGYNDTGYRPNEAFTKTVYPAHEGDRLRVTFTKFKGATFAPLNIYDGPTTSSKLIATMAFYEGPATYTASQGPLTFEFTSDYHDLNYGTWDAFFTCVTPHKYVTKQSGKFTDSSTWLLQNKDGTYTNATDYPGYIDDSIIIRTGHTVTADYYTGNKPVDEVWVQKGARLIISGGLIFTDAGKFSLTVDGDVELQGIGQLNAPGKVFIRGNLKTASYNNYVSANLYVDGGPAQEFNLAANSTISTIHLLNKNGLTIHGSLTLDSLFMNTEGGLYADSVLIRRKLTLDTGIIHLRNNSVLQFYGTEFKLAGGSSASYVSGPVSSGPGSIANFNITYPIGTAHAYRPLNLLFEKYVNDSYTIQAVEQPAPVLPLPASVDGVNKTGYYTVKTLRKYPFTNVTITMPYLAEDGVTDPANLRIVRDSASKWYDIGGVGTNVDTGTITSTARFATLGNLALANATGGANTLPVTWLQFTATPQKNDVWLQWKVSHEVNCAYYAVEHSTDGARFTAVGQAAAYNNSNSSNAYQYLHINASAGLHYYRIKEVDKDGRFGYSKTIDIYFGNRPGFTITPNPTHDAVNITTNETIKEVYCYNALGQLIKKITPSAGSYKLSLKQFAAGIYTIKVITPSGSYTHKVVKN